MRAPLLTRRWTVGGTLSPLSAARSAFSAERSTLERSSRVGKCAQRRRAVQRSRLAAFDGSHVGDSSPGATQAKWKLTFYPLIAIVFRFRIPSIRYSGDWQEGKVVMGWKMYIKNYNIL